MTDKTVNEFNVDTARMLRVLADYIEMADKDVKLKVGVKFKIRNLPLVSIPVLPSTKFGAALAVWSSDRIIDVVKNYQKQTGSTDGAELIEHFTQAKKVLSEA